MKERDKSKKKRETKTCRGWGAEKQQQKIKVLIVAFRMRPAFKPYGRDISLPVITTTFSTAE